MNTNSTLSKNIQNPSDGQNLAFDISSIPSGTYVIRIQGGDYVGNGKLVVIE